MDRKAPAIAQNIWNWATTNLVGGWNRATLPHVFTGCLWSWFLLLAMSADKPILHAFSLPHFAVCSVVSCGPYNMCFCVCHEAWGDTTTCVLYLGVCVCLVFCVLYAVSCVLRGLLLVVSLLVEWRPPVQLLRLQQLLSARPSFPTATSTPVHWKNTNQYDLHIRVRARLSSQAGWVFFVILWVRKSEASLLLWWGRWRCSWEWPWHQFKRSRSSPDQLLKLNLNSNVLISD